MGKIFSSVKHKAMSVSSPVVVVLGCTGTGKSKLAIELAQRLNGEIISADSMQVYKGLDIVTNKVSSLEQKEAVHHLINVVEPVHRYTVIDFRNSALHIIEELIRKKKLPIIVGGTNYYIESVLWDVLINPQDTKDELLFEKEAAESGKCASEHDSLPTNVDGIFKHQITHNSLDHLPNETLHEVLQQVDPAMADALHPHDRRKVIRSLQVYQQHGCTHSDLLSKQRAANGGSSLGGPLRYPDTVMLWIQCEQEVLEQRLDERVDEMMVKGLIEELLNFHKHYNESRLNKRKNETDSSYEEGIFQSIGFKEFHQYLLLSEDERNSEGGQKILASAVENMKCITKKYAKKQIKWMRNRFLRKPDRPVPPVFALNATDLSLWEKNVLEPAMEILHSVLQKEVPSQSPLPIEEAIEDYPESHYCDVCQRIFVGRRTWEIHLNSKKHSKMKSRLKKMKTESNSQTQEN